MKTATTTLVLLVLLALPTFAQKQGHGQGKNGGNHGNKMQQNLNLTPEQMEQLAPLKDEQIAAMKKGRETLRTLKKELMTELSKEKPSQKAINSITQKIGDTTRDLQRSRAEHLLKTRTILTAEQYQILIDLRMQHQNKGHKGAHNGKGMGQGQGSSRN